MRDNLPKAGPFKNEYGIINLDTTRGRGTHWTAYKKCGNLVYWFDSFGNLTPPLEVQSYFKNCKILYNNETFQKFNTVICGHLCLQFLKSENLKCL